MKLCPDLKGKDAKRRASVDSKERLVIRLSRIKLVHY